MFGKGKPKHKDDERCSKCGHYLVAPGASWTARADGHQWRGNSAKDLTKTWPIAAPRTKSATRVRLEQSLALGVCSCACALATQMPGAVGTVVFVASTSFILSVALGKENQEAIFRLLDRNKDGRIGLDDVRQVIDEMFPDDDVPQNVVVHEPPPIILTDKKGARPIPGVAIPIVHKVVIRKATRTRKALEIEVGALCEFVRQAVKCGKWGKRDWAGETVGGVRISQAIWADYRRYFLRDDIGLWELGPQDPPTLDKILANFRLTATNQPKPTNQPEV